MSKEKTKYKIISVNTASSSADISTKILQDAIDANSKWMLLQIYGSNEKMIFYSNERKECEQKQEELIKDDDLNEMREKIDQSLIPISNWDYKDLGDRPFRTYEDINRKKYLRYKGDDGYFIPDPDTGEQGTKILFK